MSIVTDNINKLANTSGVNSGDQDLAPYATNVAMAGRAFKKARANHTGPGPTTLTPDDLDGSKYHTNLGATSDVPLDLPAGVEGMVGHFRIREAHYIQLNADGTDTFKYGENIGLPGGYVRTNILGNYFTIEFLNGSWVIYGLGSTILADE